MKKKLMMYMLIILIISLSLVITLFIFIGNLQYIDKTKKVLASNNKLIWNLLENENVTNITYNEKQSIDSNDIRITFINKKGKVISDSKINESTMDNHNSRDEIMAARQKGIGYRIRYSKLTGRETMYFATVFGDGNIIRSSVNLDMVTGFEGKYIKYYLLIVTFVVIISFIFSSKLSLSIVRPIKDLEFITSRIARGELDRRVNINSQDEIGQLGNTFNDMAEKLQITLKDAIDKQNKIEAILKSMNGGIIAIDSNFKVIMINPYAKEIFGIDKDIIGENFLDNIRNFELEDLFRNPKDDYVETKVLWPKERELRVKTADIKNGKEFIGTVAVVEDVTDIKRLENIRSQFVANVSHELKTPLTSIKGFAETLRYVDDEKNKEKFLGIINDEAERLTRLINDILTLANIENIKVIKEEYIDINEIINNICDIVSNYANKKNIKIHRNYSAHVRIIGNRDRFKQMMINLIDNAIKYNNLNGDIFVNISEDERDYIIEVKDTGVGIPKEHLNRIFERFYRVDKARSRDQGGTGLGLAIVKHIIIGLKGTIEVKSEFPKGTSFIVRVPIKDTN